jgi:uncharacterized RDD family membrane protein YckC
MEEEKFTWSASDLAHPGKRYQAQFIDGIVSLLLFALCIYIFKLLGMQGTAVNAAIIVIPFAYFVLSDAMHNGQSIGKKFISIKVVSKTTGKPCKIWQSTMRNIFTPLLGALDAVLILGKKRQRLGDLMANTIVVKVANKSLKDAP